MGNLLCDTHGSCLCEVRMTWHYFIIYLKCSGYLLQHEILRTVFITFL
jgi:hypothetical protein